MAENRQTTSNVPEKGDVSGVRNTDPKREKLLRDARERLSKVDVRSNGTEDGTDRKIRERAMELIATECLAPNFPEDRLSKLIEKIEEILKRKDLDVEKIIAASKMAVEEVRKWLPDYDRKLRDIDRRIVGFGDDLTNLKKERDSEMGVFMKLGDVIASASGKEGLEKKYENLFNQTKAAAVQEIKNINVLLEKGGLTPEQKARLEGQKKLLSNFQHAQWENAGALSAIINSVKSAPEHAKTAAYAATGVVKGTVMGVVDTVVGVAEIAIMLAKMTAGNAEAQEQGRIISEFIKENGLGGMAAAAVEEFSKEWARIQALPKEEQTEAIGGMAGRVISIIVPVGGAAKLATTGARAAGAGVKWTRVAETAITKSARRGRLTPEPKPLSTPIPNASATARTAPRTTPLSTPVPTPLSTPVPLAAMAWSANAELLAAMAVASVTIPAQAKEFVERSRKFERFDAILSNIGYPYGIRNLVRNDQDVVRVWTELFGANADLYAHIGGMDALKEYLLPYFQDSLGRMEKAGTLKKEYSRLASGDREGQKNNTDAEWESRTDFSNGYDQVSDFYKKSNSGESIRVSDSISVTKTGGGGIELRTPSGKLKFDPSEAEGAIQQLDLLNTAGAEFLIPAMKEIAKMSGIDLKNGITRTESRKILSSLSNAFGISGISDEPDPRAMLEKFAVAASGGIDGKTLAAKARDPKMEILKDGVLNPKALVRAMSGYWWEKTEKESGVAA